MDSLFGAQRLILQTIAKGQGDSTNFADDGELAKRTDIALDQVRNWLETLQHAGFIEMARTEGGFKVAITAKGRLALSGFQPFQEFQKDNVEYLEVDQGHLKNPLIALLPVARGRRALMRCHGEKGQPGETAHFHFEL